MPIYKIPSRRSTGRRARTTFTRLRLVAIVLSCLLLSVTFLLLLHGIR